MRPLHITLKIDLSVTKIKHLSIIQLPSVIPAKAGIHAERVLFNWIPAFAGMTIGMNCYVLAFSSYQCSILVTLNCFPIYGQFYQLVRDYKSAIMIRDRINELVEASENSPAIYCRDENLKMILDTKLKFVFVLFFLELGEITAV